jgi:hypothetical protein
VTDILPDSISAGLTLDITVTLTAYPAPDWALSVILRGPQSIDLNATADGTQHRIQADANATANWEAGDYWFSVRVTDGTNVHQVDEGTITIKPDLAAITGPYDGRGHVEKVLDAIEAVIQGRATKDQQRYKINNRELERTPIGDLLKLRSTYREELRRIKAAEGGQSLLGRKVMVRF